MSSSTKKKSRRSKRRRRRGGGAKIAGSLLGAIFAPMLAAGVKAMLTAKVRPPRLRHTGFLDVGGGYGGLWGIPGYGSDAEGSGVFRFKAGYRTRPLGQDHGMALELALDVAVRGLGSGPAEEGGYSLSRVGGELRLFTQARRRAQPYLQAGCAYYTLGVNRDHTGPGVSAGGGLLLWPSKRLAIDLNLLYDAAFLPGIEPTLHGVTVSTGLRFYF